MNGASPAALAVERALSQSESEQSWAAEPLSARSAAVGQIVVYYATEQLAEVEVAAGTAAGLGCRGRTYASQDPAAYVEGALVLEDVKRQQGGATDKGRGQRGTVTGSRPAGASQDSEKAARSAEMDRVLTEVGHPAVVGTETTHYDRVG